MLHMGYLFKRKRSKFWYARWQANGQEHIVSTKCRDRSEAAAQLLRLEAGGSEVDLLLHGFCRFVEATTCRQYVTQFLGVCGQSNWLLLRVV